jgi:APA family basic amino acid/polyamine antiporter
MEPAMITELPRTIRFWGASAIMVGIIIGSGIFQTPLDIAQQSGSPPVILGFWLIGGLLSLAGALTYAELATMHPESGGVYVFLREAYGRGMAFVFGWTYLLLSKPFAAAGIAIIFANNLVDVLGVKWDPRVVTTVLLVALTCINVLGLRLGSGVAGVLTTVKVSALVALVVLGLVARKGAGNLAPTADPVTLMAAIAPIMVLVMWTYDGWSDVGAIAGEVRDPQKELPRIYFAGTAMVTVLYVAVNAVYMWVVPLEEMRTMTTLAPEVVSRLLGTTGGVAAVLVSVVILISALGSTHGSIITGARVTYAQARDGLLFRFLGQVSPRFGTPAVSLWMQLVLSCGALWIAGSFQALASTFVFTMWIFYGLAGAAIFILRVKRPEAPRPYRCWGYPVVPGLFVLAAAAMTVLSIIDDWRTTGTWLLVLFAGIPVYWVWRSVTAGHAPVQPPPATG